MAKGKRYKKSSYEDKTKKLLFVTAVLNLIKSIIDFIKMFFD